MGDAGAGDQRVANANRLALHPLRGADGGRRQRIRFSEGRVFMSVGGNFKA